MDGDVGILMFNVKYRMGLMPIIAETMFNHTWNDGQKACQHLYTSKPLLNVARVCAITKHIDQNWYVTGSNSVNGAYHLLFLKC